MYKKATVLDTHLQQIAESVVPLCSKLVAIILYGGYGRDEGSWIIENNGTYRPYNDYDVLLVVENKIQTKQIERLRKDLAKQIGIRWVDIGQKTPAELRKLRPSIYNYDLKYASKIIQGDPNVLNLIPEIDATKLPLKEGETLFFTRLWTFLGSFDERGLRVDRAGEESRFFRNQMAKAMLAIVDVLLLHKGAYHSSYKERVKRLEGFYPKKKSFCKLAKWALEEKLFPKAPIMNSDDVKTLYEKVHYFFFKEMYELLTKYYRCPVDSPDAIARHLKWGWTNLIKRIGWLVLRRNMNWERGIAVNLAQSYIAADYNKGDIQQDFLKRGIRYLQQLDRSFRSDASWDEARLRVAELRMKN